MTRMHPVLPLLIAVTLMTVCACDTTWQNAAPRSGEGELPGPHTGAYDPLPAGTDLNVNFEALFCPDDPVITLELALIDQVRDALAMDGGSYDEGSNPFRIRYAVYNLRNADVVQHLIDAHAEGVDVQVLMEADQLDPERDWNWADEALIAAGFEYAPDHDAMTDAQRVTADLVGIDDSGLMHLKARLFETPDGARALSGSMNPGDNAVFNDETLHLINDPRIVARYRGAYDAVLEDRDFDNHWDEGEAVNVLFTPVASGPRPSVRLLEWLEEEDEQILLMVYSLRDLTAPGIAGSLLDILQERIDSGVPVYVITDRKQSDDYYDTTEDELRAIGAHVWEVRNESTEYTAMHHKVAVLGRTDIRVVTDAANWSRSALGSSSQGATNIESMLFIDSGALDGDRTGQRYLAQWLRVLDRYDGWGADDGEPTFTDVFGALSAQAGWPALPVYFVVDDAYTDWGEMVYVRGDLAELGAWGEEHMGVPLVTDAGSYPTWHCPVATELPLGTPLQWKAVAGYDGSSVRWEGGGNHHGTVQLPALVADSPQVLRQAWR